MKSPRYPVYVPSKGRFDKCFTVDFFRRDGTPFILVVEPSEWHHYAARYGKKDILVTPRDNMKLLGVRNWIRDHAEEAGHKRHWQFDDNIRYMHRRFKATRIRCNSGPAIAAAEDFTDRYENIGITGFNYSMFAPDKKPISPFFLNCHVYSASLINHAVPERWRLFYNDDTDLCLQVLAAGWCTVLFNAFLINKIQTMVIKGGNTTDLYQDDGRLKMARALEQAWPHVVTVDRRFKRPQHIIASQWKKFDTPLIRRKDIDWDKLKPNDYGLTLNQVSEIKSKRLQKFYEASKEEECQKQQTPN